MADARDPAGPMPNTTIKIEKTIRNAPSPDEEEMDVTTETRKPGRQRKAAAVEAEPEENEDAVAAYLQDHTVKIHIDRVSPREYKGKAIGGMIEEYVPPITIEEIETDIRNRFGGGRYRIRVLKNGRFVGARGLNIYGDPKVGEVEEDGPDFGEDFNPAAFARDPFPGGPPVVDDEITELRKQIEKEKLKNALDEVKGRMGPSNAHQQVDPDRIRREAEERVRKEMETRREMDIMKSDMDHKLDRFMSGMKELLTSQKQTDPARDHDIVSLDNKIERFKTEVMANVQTSMGEIKAMLKESQKPVEKDNTPLMMTALIDGFSKMAASGESKVQAIASSESAKTQAMMDSMRAIADAQMKVSQAQSDKLMTVIQSQNPQGIGEMSKTVGAVRDMAEALGWAPGGAGAPEGPVEQPDIMSRVMGMVEKALPSLLAANAAKSRQTGQQLNQGEIQGIIAQQAQAAAKQIAVPMAEQMAAKRVNEILAAQAQKAARDQQAAQETAAKKRADQQVQDFQRPPVVPTAAAPVNVAPPVVAAATPPPTAPPVQEMEVAPSVEDQIPVVIPEIPIAGTSDNDVEKEKSHLVNACMEVLMKEVKIRPRKPEWNEVAYDELPEDVVEKLVMVTDADGLLTVISPYAKPEYVENLKNVFASDQKAVDWFVKGLNEMKEWYAEEGQPEVEQQEASA